MSKEIFEWSALIEENRERLEKAIIDAKIDAEGIMSGCFVAVELGKDGEIYLSGIQTAGNFSMANYQGQTKVIYRAHSWEPDVDYVGELANDGKKLQEYLDQQEEGHEWVYAFVSSKYPELVAEWERQAAEFEIENLDVDAIIDLAIADMKDSEAYLRKLKEFRD